MEIIRFALDQMPEKERNLSLALGTFDALHKGHQKVFLETALGAEGTAAALLFARPYEKCPSICSLEDKIRLLGQMRLDALYILENDESLFEMDASSFIEKVLRPLGTKRVVIGEDFRFGKGKGGGIGELKAAFVTDVVPLLEEGGEKVSSSLVKAKIEKGNVDALPALLGRRYEISGAVVPGSQNGRKIGFPTINLSLSFDYVLPKGGVYVGIAYLSGIAHKAIINVGVNPTVGGLPSPRVEAHLLDYSGDAYGKRAYISFYRFLREEKRFDTLDDLRVQLEFDKADCEEYFAGMC